jgi:SAM-dependent methyltransferase
MRHVHLQSDASAASLVIPSQISRDKWRLIHDQAAQDYRRGEWIRETVFGVGRLRQQPFVQATGEVLDVACGYGMNFAYLTNATHITSVEFSPVMLNMAKPYARRLGRDITLVEGDAEALDFPDGRFDTVVSALSTCSFLHPIKALQEMRRVCKPGGRILLIEHGRSTWEWIGRYQDRHVDTMIVHGGCHWNQEPQELVQAAGPRIVAAQRIGLGIFHTIQAMPE